MEFKKVERLKQLNIIAITQIKSLVANIPENTLWLQVFLCLPAENYRIINKKTYVLGEIVYIWRDFEGGGK
jgi:hypothetical protein